MDVPKAHAPIEKPEVKKAEVKKAESPVSFSSSQTTEKPQIPKPQDRNLDYFMEQMKKRVHSYHAQNSSAEVKSKTDVFKPEIQKDRIREAVTYVSKNQTRQENEPLKISVSDKKEEVKKTEDIQKSQQLNLFEEKLLTKEMKNEYKLIGQVFDTYWLVEYHDNL